MIRFLLALLLVHFSFTLVSCTSSEVSTEQSAATDDVSSGPISDTEIGDTAATSGNLGEGDLEGELGGDLSETPAPNGKAQAEQPPPVDNAGIQDLEPAPGGGEEVA